MSNCRFCDAALTREFVDLGTSPPSNAFLKKEQLHEVEAHFPLKLFVCEKCFLVQIAEHKAAGEIFNADYVYFSSYSSSWLAHCRSYAEMAISRFGLTPRSSVVELASNDGYLLKFFKEKGIPVLGVEPTRSTADVARAQGIETVVRFFGRACAEDLARERGKADLIVANNVLAHVPDLNDFVRGIALLLADGGVATAEFPHLLRLVRQNQFDTIYHEHFSYLSFLTITRVFAAHGLAIFDVEELSTHGGSLRIYARQASNASWPTTEAVARLTEKEKSAGMDRLDFYSGFQAAADQVKNRFVGFLLEAKAARKRVVGYGAAAKGNTLLNYCGVRSDLIELVADASPHKQGRFLPESRIPVRSEKELREARPDYIVIFPWNIKDEIVEQLSYAREWGAKFVVAIPELEVF